MDSHLTLMDGLTGSQLTMVRLPQMYSHLLLRAVSLVMLPSLTPVLMADPTSRMLFLRPPRMPSPLNTASVMLFFLCVLSSEVWAWVES